MSVIDHAEKYLGKISRGWKDTSVPKGLRIVSFRDCPGKTVTTFLSLGMSDHILSLSETKKVRQELIFSVYSTADSDLVVSFLLSLCEAILDRTKAVRRGEVIPLSRELARAIKFQAIYCAIPVFFDDDFSTYDESSPATVIVWALPIYQIEIDYIKSNGWESFEDLLEKKDPDLCSLDRVPVI